MPTAPLTVLLIDDNPSHLKLYSWIVTRAGFRAVTALVEGRSVPLPREENISLSLLDYRIGDLITSVEIARQLNQLFPARPIVLLSDMPWMPDDIAPYVTTFVRKGEPQQIVDTISKLLNAGA